MNCAGMMAAMVMMAAAGVGGMTGCENPRVDMDTRVHGENGLQSRDLREMTDKMAPDLLQIREIVANPNRVVVVMKPIENHTESDRGRDMTIYVARLKTLLNSAKTRDRMAFVEEQATLRNLQAQELGNPDPFEQASRTGGPTDARIMPQYALWGTFYEKREARSRYYLCTFRMTDLHTGLQVWENSYEVRTLEN